VLGSALAVWILRVPPEHLPMVQAVPAGLPSIASPDVSWDLFRDIVPGAMAAAILGAVEALVISGAIATKTGQDVDNRWQLVGQGLANMGCGLLRGLPCSSSFTRSFLNLQEGARSQLAAMFAAAWILFVVLLLGPLVQHVPQACLAGVLIVLAYRLPDWRRIRTMLRATPSDRAALLITFAATMVVRLDTALYVGVLVSLALFLRKAQTPHLVEYVVGPTRRMRQIERREERSHPAICMLHVEGDLFFAAAEAFEKEVRRVAQDPALKVIVLRMRNARNLDATSALTLGNLASWLRGRGQRLLVSGVSGDADKILERSGIIDIIGRENVFFSDKSILTSTRDALLAAQRLVGASELRILHAEDEDGWEAESPAVS
jgi:SulP family sulfate permease